MTDAPRIQYSEFIGDGQVVFRVESVDALKAEARLLAEASGEISAAFGAVKTAAGVTKAATENKAPQRRSYQRSQNSGGSTGGSTGGASTPSDISCEHGKPYNDVRGKTYQSGAKQGQPYAYELYASCGNRDCKPRNF